MTDPANSLTDTLYYDGACPICRREINFLNKLKRPTLSLQDIHALTKDDQQTQNIPNRDVLLSILHLRTNEGEWHLGLDATVLAWNHTRWGWLLAPLRWPLIKVVADKAYARWAANRVCRLT